MKVADRNCESCIFFQRWCSSGYHVVCFEVRPLAKSKLRDASRYDAAPGSGDVDVAVWSTKCAVRGRQRGQILEGSFVAVSKPIFGSKHSWKNLDGFCKHWQETVPKHW